MDLEAKHNQAIREEIGERLRILLSREQPSMPDHLRPLLRRLAKMERRFAIRVSPSIMPDLPPQLRRTVTGRARR